MSFEIQSLVVQAKVPDDNAPPTEDVGGRDDGGDAAAQAVLSALPRLLRSEVRKLRPGSFSSPSRPRFDR